VLKKGKSVADLKGRKINMVELSVSHYLLARALTGAKLKSRTSRSSTPRTPTSSRRSSRRTPTAVVTWNPQLMEVKAEPGAALVYDPARSRRSSTPWDQYRDAEGRPQPGQGAGRHLVRDHRADGRQGRRGQGGARGDGQLSGTDLVGFEAQLKTTRMFYTPKDAVAFTTGADLAKTMDLVRTFSFEHNLLGEGGRARMRSASPSSGQVTQQGGAAA
jgi:NitT/TauT family transport system substrate-binding protein